MKCDSEIPRWHENFRRRIGALASSLDFPDFTFSVILLIIHSILWPYRGLVHDAKLYALQAINHSQGGKFAHDLFFAFGSQDSFSLFSATIGPLVALMGATNALWVAYMASSMLLIYGEVRLIRRIIPDRLLGDLGIIALVALPLPYGGWEVFHVQESFLTARLIAEGFALIGLDAALQDRKLKAFGFVLGSIALHALMGVSALLVVLGILLWHKLHLKKEIYVIFSMLIFILGLLLILNWESIRPLIPYMDAKWLSAVRNANYQCFPSQWRLIDWYRIIGCIAVCVAAGRWLVPKAKVMVRMIILVGIGGVISTIFGEYSSIPLLLQGQGYRAFWLVEIVTLPLGILLIRRLFSGESVYGKWAALGVFIFLGDPLFLYCEIVPFSLTNLSIYWIFLGITAVLCLHKPRVFDRITIRYALPACCLALLTLLSLLSVGVLIQTGVSERLDPIETAYFVGNNSCRTFLFTIAVLVVAGVSWLIHKWRKQGLVWAVPLWIILSAVPLVVQNSIPYRASFQRGYKDVRFIAETIKKDRGAQALDVNDQIYWPMHSDLIWFDLNSNSYYSFFQLAGALFSNELTIEGQRRAMLARPFEVSWLKKNPSYSKYQDVMLANLNATLHEPAVRREDVLRLATDKTLDWMVLDQGFDGLYSATNKSVFVYNCSKIRQTATGKSGK
jgi:hypothetical protein